MKAYLVEFVGTFFLVLLIGLVVIDPGAGAFAAIAIGCGLAGLIYAGGHISFAHYNPAVTLAFWICGRHAEKDILPYLIAQCGGALLAAPVALMLKGNPSIVVSSPDVTAALIAEFLFTFLLVWVILNVAIASTTAGNDSYGLAIGWTVLGGIYAVGDISGAVFNPAVALGVTAMGLSSASNVWIYLVANFAGAVAAALLFKATAEIAES